MKHTLFAKKSLLAIIVIAFSLALNAQTSGTCGDNLTWNYNTDTHIITISGTGDMYDYEGERTPWYDIEIYHVIIENGVTSIGKWAFHSHVELEDVALPNSIITIGEYAFCETSLTSVEIPNSVLTIGDHAFEFCNIVTLTLGNSLTYIGVSAFELNSIQSLDIPNSVLTIGDKAFQGCWMRTLTLGNSLTHIGNRAFGSCEIDDLTLPNSVTYIGDEAFMGQRCDTLIIPNSVIHIGYCAFVGNERLKTILVEDDNEFYDSRDNCNALIETATNTLLAGCRNTIIPNSVEIIDEFSFRDVRFKSISIPNSVTNIGYGAFYNCPIMSSVTIGSSVESIGISAFSFCDLLDTICCNATVPPVCTDFTFNESTQMDAKLFVPVGCVEAYRNAPIWKYFENIYEQVDGVDENLAVNISVYPNPATNFINIKCENIKSLEIISLEGKSVRKMTPTNDETNIDVSDMTRGVYVIKAMTENGETVENEIIIK